ncbi:hypothetical protein ACJX0J_034773, partial [Zea mays]
GTEVVRTENGPKREGSIQQRRTNIEVARIGSNALAGLRRRPYPKFQKPRTLLQAQNARPLRDSDDHVRLFHPAVIPMSTSYHLLLTRP